MSEGFADTRLSGFEPSTLWMFAVLELARLPLVQLPLPLPPAIPAAPPGTLPTTTDPAAVPMSGVNLGDAMMGVNGTKGRSVVWLIRDERSTADDDELDRPDAAAWLKENEGLEAR